MNIVTDLKDHFSQLSSDAKLTAAGITFGAVVLTRLLYYSYQNAKFPRKKIILEKQKERQKRFDELRSRLNLKGNVSQIEGLSAEEVIEKVKKKTLSPLDVLQCFQHKALLVHEKTNCLVEPVPEAESIAAACLTSEGLLTGLPVSIKENYGFKGLDCTAGCSRTLFQPLTEDCVVVQVLKRQGAVPFVRTNVPQTMLSWETSNPIYGLTTNPLDRKRTVGGSSGGEAALLAGGGSLLGFGSDIGGSLRIPAAMCGICSLKPTAGRISGKGTHPIFKGQKCVLSSVGPMAQDVDTLALAMKAVLVPYMWQLDPNVPPLPFKTEVYESRAPLTIGYYVDDGQFPSVPAMKRAVHLAKQLLQNQGCKVVEWKMTKPYFNDAYRVWAKAVLGDGGTEIQQYTRGDLIDKLAIGPMIGIIALPNIIKRVLIHVLHCFSQGRVLAGGLEAVLGVGSVNAWWQLTREAQDIQKSIIDEWRMNHFDAVVCPGFTCPAVPVGYPALCPAATSYTAVFNVLNFTAGSLPVTTVTAADEANMADYPSSNTYLQAMKRGMVGSTGLPVNLQVVTLPYQEELCLRVMKELETAVRQNNKK